MDHTRNNNIMANTLSAYIHGPASPANTPRILSLPSMVPDLVFFRQNCVYLFT